MTLNGVMALTLRYFTEFVIYDVVVKKFTFAISSPDEFVVYAFKSASEFHTLFSL